MSERLFRGHDDAGSTVLRVFADRIEIERPGTTEPSVIVPFRQIVWVEIGGGTQGSTADLVLTLRGRGVIVRGIAREEIWDAYNCILEAARITGRWGY